MDLPEGNEPIIVLVIIALSIAVLINFLVIGRRRRGSVIGSEPDARAWAPYAGVRGLHLVPGNRQCRMSGALEGFSVWVEASWTPADRRHGMPRMSLTRFGGGNYHWIAGTSVRMAVGARLPAGLQLRRQGLLDGLADKLVAGDRIQAGDPQIDAAFIVHGTDPLSVGTFVAADGVRAAILELAKIDGELTIDESAIRVELPTFASDAAIDTVFEAMIAAAHVFRAATGAVTTALAEPDQPAPPTPVRPIVLQRPTLVGMFRRVDSAGGATTQVGRDQLATIIGQSCRLEIDVERVEPWTTRLGAHGGISLGGTLVGWTSRIEANAAPGDIAEAARAFKPGDRVAFDALLEVYDPLRNRAELMIDTAPTAIAGGKAHAATPQANLAEAAVSSGDVRAIVDAMATGREARNRVLVGVRGRVLRATWVIRTIERSPAWKVDDALRNGRTALAVVRGGEPIAEVRFPEAFNAVLDGAGVADQTVDARLVSWNEVQHRSVWDVSG
jgi:hypothetical protein